MSSDIFTERRARFAKAIGDGIAIMPAAAERNRNSDVDYEFRQDSDFFYLTGFDEPDAVAMIDPGATGEEYVLFVRPRDRELEIWNGYRAGVEGATGRYGADAAYPLSELDAQLRKRLLGRRALYYAAGNQAHDARIDRALRGARGQANRYGTGAPFEVRDPSPVLHEMRLIKSDADLDALQRACNASVAGHLEAMRFAAPGRYEYQAQAAMEYVFRSSGSPRNGYPSIVASGPNACILHYTENRRLMEEGDLLLVDAGAEVDYFSADITRTFPVSGRFSTSQRAVYEVVLAAQRAALDVAVPGATMRAGHEAARDAITAGLVELGLIPGDGDPIAMHHYREYFMHGTGHWLGMDVHDVGSYRFDGEHRSLQPGMAFTIEPGVYIAPDRPVVTFPLLEYDLDDWMQRRYLLGADAAKAEERKQIEAAATIEHPIPDEFLGIGIRIEDDVVITGDGHRNLTAAVPTSIDGVEAVCAEESRLPIWGD